MMDEMNRTGGRKIDKDEEWERKIEESKSI
jgi:hypothetical protein